MPSYLIVLLIFAWLAILAGGWLGWQLLRQNGRILLRLDELEKRLNELEFGEGEQPAGLPIGSQAPAFESPDLAGEGKSLAQFRGQPLLLIFFNPECGFCRDLAPKLAALTPGRSRREEAHSERTEAQNPKSKSSQSLVTSAATRGEFSGGRPHLVILTAGDLDQNRQFFREHKLDCPVLLQNDGEVAKAYQAHGTPTGYLISADGKIASELAMGADALLKLVSGDPHPRPLSHPMGEGGHRPCEGARANRFSNHSLARSKIKRDGLKAGTPAPDFRLPRLDGRGDLSLEELRGRRVLLVFSSPHCGPCNTLAPALEKFHREHRTTGHPLTLSPPSEGERGNLSEIAVVMISKGDPKENRTKVKEHRLTFPIVLQQQWEISRKYAMFATPIAYLINEQGVIAADVAVGVEPILALLVDADGQAQEREQVLR